MRGYGDSAKPTDVFDYGMSYLVDDIKGIVTELGMHPANYVLSDI